MLYFTHLPRSPQSVDLYQIWSRGSPPGRNQLCRFFRWSVQGYRFCGGGNLLISIRIEGRRWHCLNYRSDCDIQYEMWDQIDKACIKRRLAKEGIFPWSTWPVAFVWGVCPTFHLGNEQQQQVLRGSHLCGVNSQKWRTPSVHVGVFLRISLRSRDFESDQYNGLAIEPEIEARTAVPFALFAK